MNPLYLFIFGFFFCLPIFAHAREEACDEDTQERTQIIEKDENQDGQNDLIYQVVYNEFGAILQTKVERWVDGVWDQNQSDYYFDEKGNMIFETYDHSHSDKQGTYSKFYQYDSEGRQIASFSDFGRTGSWSEGEKNVYNESGKLISQVLRLNDSELNEENTPVKQSPKLFATTFEYDAQGRETQVHYDSNQDGVPDRSRRVEYDAQGREIFSSFDEDGDGEPEEVNTRLYNSQGDILSEFYDQDGNGKNDFETTYEYNEEGKVSIIRIYDFNDPASNATRYHTYHESGLLMSIYQESENHKTLQKNEIDSEGRLLSSSFDRNADGIPEILNEYNEQGFSIRSVYDNDSDGKIDSIYTSEFDANGNEISSSIDENGDGVFERKETTVSRCFKGRPSNFQQPALPDWVLRNESPVSETFFAIQVSEAAPRIQQIPESFPDVSAKPVLQDEESHTVIVESIPTFEPTRSVRTTASYKKWMIGGLVVAFGVWLLRVVWRSNSKRP